MTTTRAAVTPELETLLSFIAAELQLPLSLHAKAQERYKVITDLLQQSRLGRYSIEVYSQGSYRIGTTVKPLSGEEFDLDFVMELTALDERTDPVDLVNAVWEVFKASPHHSAMVERHTSCIRLVYADEFHMDVVPAVPHRSHGDTAILIPRKNGDGVVWHGTDPKGYAAWFENVSAWRMMAKTMKIEPLPRPLPANEKTAIQTCVQLYKRNHHVNVDEELRTASIVLTTITAQSAKDAKALGDAFNCLVDSLPAFVGHATPPVIVNPAAPYEIISEKWAAEPQRYDEFEEHTARLRQDWDELLLLQGRDHAVLVKKLGEMFGDAPVVERAVKALSEQRQAARAAGALVAGAGGVLQIDPARRGKLHTYYGGG